MQKETQTQEGIILQGIGSFYTAGTDDGTTYTLRCKKKFRRQGISPLTGDRVLFTPGTGEEHGWLEEILPRKTVCLRPPVANAETLVIVLAPVPAPDLLLTDRLISRARAQGIRVVIAVNKDDLDTALKDQIRREYAGAEIRVVPVCARNRTGLDTLRKEMEGSLCCVTGQSGVGKTTLLNALLGLELETGDISRKIARGKNTTRCAELIRKNGLQVVDTAGFNLLETERNMAPETLKERYPEFLQYEGKCRFHACLHDREPGCAVTRAVQEGDIAAERVERYRLLLAEVRESWRERYD